MPMFIAEARGMPFTNIDISTWGSYSERYDFCAMQTKDEQDNLPRLPVDTDLDNRGPLADGFTGG